MIPTIYTIRREYSGTLYYQGSAVLTYTVEYPQFASVVKLPGLDQINALFRMRAVNFVRYVRENLYNQAVQGYVGAQQEGFPFVPYEARDDFSITYALSPYVSLYFDRYEFTGGAHGNTVRQGYTFDVRTGGQMRLGDFFAPGVDDNSAIKQEIIRQIGLSPDVYFDDAPQLVEEYYNPDNFFIEEPGTLAIFFQQYEISPYSSGIPVFSIPSAAVDFRL